MANYTNISRKFGAALAALVISAAFVTAAVGPAASTASASAGTYAAASSLVQEKQA